MLERSLWWHRIRGHHIEKGYGLLSPAAAYWCTDCDKKWVRSLL